MLLTLRLLEQICDGKAIRDEDVVKALYFAHMDRAESPVTDLSDFGKTISNKLSKAYVEALLAAPPLIEEEKNTAKTGETTHFSVVDDEDNAIAVTASINAYFGALAASGKLGFLYNTYMDDFIFEDPEHPFAVKPNAMAYSSMSPTIAQKKGKTVLVLGSPGSSRIISTVAQITARWTETKNIGDLISMPRIHVRKHRVYFEKKEDSASRDTVFFKDYGLKIVFPNDDLLMRRNLHPYYGGVHAIARENGKWTGAADPRRDGKHIVVVNE